MSSLVERLRVRSDKRPLYSLLEESDDELYFSKSGIDGGCSKNKAGEDFPSQPLEKFMRIDAKEEACQFCGKPEDLILCTTCTYAFHGKCLIPPKVASDDKWSCPECVSRLTLVEKILDCELRPCTVDVLDPLQAVSKQVNVKHYLVKWKGLSYIHCTWIPENEFLVASKTYPRLKTRLNNFNKQVESIRKSDDDWAAIRPEWTTVDRILASREAYNELQYFVKWKELGYDECTWENESDISVFQPQIERFHVIQSKQHRRPFTEFHCGNRERHAYLQSPDFLSGGTLHPYQLEGLNFLRFSWLNNRRVILADEMGLGKTIQSIAFLASLFEENRLPHLVVAPLSTLRNWEREFATWAPHMNVVMYFGSAQAREVLRKYEFYFPKEESKDLKKRKQINNENQRKHSKIKFDVLLTSYEMINMDSTVLKPISWECMIVDEGHRLKNKDSKLFGQLKDYPTNHRVLLTGTPIQNNLDELFMLMHFLEGETFGSIAELQEEFKDINQDRQIEKLHALLKPHLLRRFKKDVMKELPPKKELILRVELTNKQKEYYKAILTRNYQVLARRGGAQISLINVVMELRKVCCHAYMLEGVEPESTANTKEEGVRQLLDASGKMQLLDKMLVKLKEQGHRVLIYSQFQHMLDLLEDYLTYKEWTYERIDGKIGGAERQIRIDRFNSKNSTRFCFLLSTRAGGLGINLATADTVFIYDSDWNPHADLQAMARAHRLGQTSKVMIYRLICRGTIEERMMEMTKKKMVLEHLVVGRLKAQAVNQEELDDIIRYGSKELFADENEDAGEARHIHYDETAIERLLNRDQINNEETLEDDDDSDFLKGFKVANFEYIDESKALGPKDEMTKHSMNDKFSNSERVSFWDELLRDRYGVHQEEEYTAMGKGKRSRRQMAASDGNDLGALQDASSEDDDECYDDDLSDIETSVPGTGPGRRGPSSKKKSRSYAESLPLVEGEGKSQKVVGFNHHQRTVFLQILMRFGFQDSKWGEFLPRLRGKSVHEIQRYAEVFVLHLLEEPNDSPTFADGVPKESWNVDDIMVRLANIELIEKKVKFIAENGQSSLFPRYIYSEYPGLLNGRIWKEEHDLVLLKALLKHGYARWQSIVEDKEIGLAEIGRRELNLPAFSNAFIEASQQGNLEESRANQIGPDCSYQYRELQRRIVEFIRRRYHLLEKALQIECAVIENNIDVSEDPTETKAAEAPTYLTTSTPGEPGSASEPEQPEVVQLYKKMCSTVEESDAADALQSHLGDKEATSRTINVLPELPCVCEDPTSVFAAPEQNICSEQPESVLKLEVADNGKVEDSQERP